MKAPALLRRTRLFEGKVFDVDRDRLRFDDGRETDVDIVRHPASVVLLPMPTPDTLVLVRQYRHPIARWIWELPAGSTDAGETPEAAAARECHEEIALTPGRVSRLGALVPTPGYCDEEMIFYLLEDLREPQVAAAQDEDEQLEPRIFSLDQLDAMAARAELIDMKTLCGLALLRQRLARRGPVDR